MDIVESLYSQARDLDAFLLSNQEISLKVYADSNLRKSILLASASFYEKQICDLVLDYAKKCTSEEMLVHFIENKAISRQYHTFFDWKNKSCNSFYGLFGEEFKNKFSAMVKSNSALDESARAFLEIGSERNRMVHQNYGGYTLEKTIDEIYEIHKKARYFVEEIKSSLMA